MEVTLAKLDTVQEQHLKWLLVCFSLEWQVWDSRD